VSFQFQSKSSALLAVLSTVQDSGFDAALERSLPTYLGSVLSLGRRGRSRLLEANSSMNESKQDIAPTVHRSPSSLLALESCDRRAIARSFFS
jgi:hypothetical protein